MSKEKIVQNQENIIPVNVKVKLATMEYLQEVVQKVEEIEKEHNVSCTLDVEIGY